MSVSSRKEIRDSVLDHTRQNNAQIGSLVNDFINLSLNEINDPGWAFPRKNFNHLWSWLRKKDTISVSAEDAVLPRDVDKIALVRQTDTPVKLLQLTDEKFYKVVPNPTATGNPRFYRIWERDGVSTRLAAADTIDVVSSSASDAGSAELAVSVTGYDANDILITEAYQLNGTTTVSGTKTFAARDLYVTKQKNTTGDVTVTENSGGTTLVVLGATERAAKFKVISFYPIPTSATTIYLEYFTTIPELENDSDVPLFDRKWHWVVRMGAVAKVYQYLNKESDFLSTQNMYASGVRSMVASDRTRPDLLTHLTPSKPFFPFIHQVRSEDVVA